MPGGEPATMMTWSPSTTRPAVEQHLVDLQRHLVGVPGLGDEERLDAPGQRELADGSLDRREREHREPGPQPGRAAARSRRLA